MKMFGSSVRVKIPRDLYDRLARQVERRGYANVEEALQDILEREVGGEDSTATDDEEMERRLRGLGYIR